MKRLNLQEIRAAPCCEDDDEQISGTCRFDRLAVTWHVGQFEYRYRVTPRSRNDFNRIENKKHNQVGLANAGGLGSGASKHPDQMRIIIRNHPLRLVGAKHRRRECVNKFAKRLGGII